MFRHRSLAMKNAENTLLASIGIAVLCFVTVHAKIGYFWHITDLHYDHLYTPHGDVRKNCWQSDSRGSSAYHRSPGKYGNPACDSPWSLIEAAAQYMKTKHRDNVEFVLWTGDAVSTFNSAIGLDHRLALMRNITDLLSHTFSSQFVFPVLGHEDPPPSSSLNHMWMHWLPTEALQTFEIGGYYTIEQSHSKLRIVALNTNLFLGGRGREILHPLGLQQWSWLEKTLAKAAQKDEMVYILGHVAPGADERAGGILPPAHASYAPEHNRRYLNLVRRYSRVIAGQFFGHLHSDTFRVMYGEQGKPISWAMIAPSVTPHRSAHRANNPGIRLYKFNTDKGQVLDYTQYYMDIESANKDEEPEWTTEYNLNNYYGLHEISAQSFHNLAERLTYSNPTENNLFTRYIKANSVRAQDGHSSLCENACAHAHYCAITRVDYDDYRRCVEAAASALASTATRIYVRFLSSFLWTLILIVCRDALCK